MTVGYAVLLAHIFEFAKTIGLQYVNIVENNIILLYADKYVRLHSSHVPREQKYTFLRGTMKFANKIDMQKLNILRNATWVVFQWGNQIRIWEIISQLLFYI